MAEQGGGAGGIVSDQERRIAADYQKRVSLQALSAKYGLSRDAITRVLRNQGVTIRPET